MSGLELVSKKVKALLPTLHGFFGRIETKRKKVINKEIAPQLP